MGFSTSRPQDVKDPSRLTTCFSCLALVGFRQTVEKINQQVGRITFLYRDEL